MLDLSDAEQASEPRVFHLNVFMKIARFVADEVKILQHEMPDPFVFPLANRLGEVIPKQALVSSQRLLVFEALLFRSLVGRHGLKLDEPVQIKPPWRAFLMQVGVESAGGVRQQVVFHVDVDAERVFRGRKKNRLVRLA